MARSSKRSTALVVVMTDILVLLLVLLDAAAASEEAVRDKRPNEIDPITWRLLDNTLTACSKILCDEHVGIHHPPCEGRPDLVALHRPHCVDKIYPTLEQTCNNERVYDDRSYDDDGKMLRWDVELFRDSCIEFCRNASKADVDKKCLNPAQCEQGCKYMAYNWRVNSRH